MINSGRVSVELADLDASDGFRIDGSGNREYSGSHAIVMGDINGDGLDDILERIWI